MSVSVAPPLFVWEEITSSSFGEETRYYETRRIESS